MHSLLHTDYTRALAADPRRGPAGSGAPRPPRPDAPPGRLRPLLAHALGAAAGRIDREVARRAVA
jgi:hypothetical protein